MGDETLNGDDSGPDDLVWTGIKEVGWGLLGSTLIYLAIFVTGLLLESRADWSTFSVVIPTFILFVLTPLIGVSDFPWSWGFPWLVPILLVGFFAMAFRLTPVRYLRYSVAILFSLWWLYGFWIHYAIYSGV